MRKTANKPKFDLKSLRLKSRLGPPRALIFLAAFLMSGLAQAQAQLQSDKNICRIQRRPVAIVASGGTSLGAYQAGAYARLLQSLKSEASRYELKLISGASAGGVNSLLAFQDFCSSERASASGTESQWLYDFWNAPITQKLFRPQQDKAQTSLLNPEAFGEIQKQFFASLQQSRHHCDLILSIPLTLRQPMKLNLSGTQKSYSQFLNFTLRAKPGQPANFENYVNPFEAQSTALLDLSQPMTTLENLAMATAAIPYIFPVRPMSFCSLSKDDPRNMHLRPPFACPVDQVIQGEFMDGALLETTPMAAALRTLKRGLVANCSDQKAEWLAIPSRDSQAQTLSRTPRMIGQTLIVNLDVSNREPSANSTSASVTGGVLNLVSDLLRSARDRELLNVLEEENDVRGQILSLGSHFPRFSEEWNGFFGFFDRELRAFDYWIGYVDMDESLRKDFPDLAGAKRSAPSPLGRCLQKLVSDPSFECPELSSQEQILLQTLKKELRRTNSNSAQAPSVERSRFYNRMQALSDQQFEFKELGLSPSATSRAPTLVRGWIQQSSRAMSSAYPEDSGTTLDAVSGFLFGLTDPVATEHIRHITWGSSFEMGYSRLLSIDYNDRQFWRWPVALELYSPRGLTTSSSTAAAASFLTGIELQKPVSSSLDYIAAVRIGYQFSNRNGETLAELQCRDGILESCNGITLSPMVAAVFFGTLRLQTGLKITWDSKDASNVNSAAMFSGGLQF